MSAVAHRQRDHGTHASNSVFVPPTFLAGVYGMNFTMPELSLRCLPGSTDNDGPDDVSTLFYFYRRGWLMRAPIETRSNA